MQNSVEKDQVESLLGNLDSLREGDNSKGNIDSMAWQLDLMLAKGNRYALQIEELLRKDGCHPLKLKQTDNPSDDFLPASQELRKIIYS